MTEEEYIAATDLSHIRDAQAALHMVSSFDGVVRRVYGLLTDRRIELEAEVERLMHADEKAV